VRSGDLRHRRKKASSVHLRRHKTVRVRAGYKLRHRKKEQAGCKSHDHSTERVGRRIRHRSSVPDVHTIRRRYSKDAGSILGSYRDRLRKSIPEERHCRSDAGRSYHCVVILAARLNRAHYRAAAQRFAERS
jgi:hypothetical protein